MSWIFGYGEQEEEVEPQIDFRQEYPLHAAVIEKDLKMLSSLIENEESEEPEEPLAEVVDIYDKLINRRDCRGYSPLTLCILTGFTDGAKLLLDQGAFIRTRHPERHYHSGHACIMTHNRDILKDLLRSDMKYMAKRMQKSGPILRERLKASKSFAMELDWNFTSWIPLTGRFCPSDSWKIWKDGDKARLDFTLIDFDQTAMRWVRGDMSVIILPNEETGVVEAHIIDHEKKNVSVTNQQKELEPKEIDIDFQTEMFLQTEIFLPKFDVMDIEFKPVEGYVWGEYRGETDGYPTQDFKLTNIQTRFNYCDGHIPEEMKTKEFKEERGKNMQEQMRFIDELQSEQEKDAAMQQLIDQIKVDYEVPELVEPTLEEYFEEELDIEPYKISTYSKDISLNVTVADKYPLNLKEDVLPILECLARAQNPMLEKLQQFLDVDFPEGGFPVKVELPLYKVFKATVKFQKCTNADIDDSIFEIPDYPLKHGDTAV